MWLSLVKHTTTVCRVGGGSGDVPVITSATASQLLYYLRAQRVPRPARSRRAKVINAARCQCVAMGALRAIVEAYWRAGPRSARLPVALSAGD